MIPPDELTELVARSRHWPDQYKGGNSTVTRLEWRGRQVAVKDYSSCANAGARLSREWEGLRLLWSLGIRFVPEPLGADFDAQIGVQEWVRGRSPSMDSTTVAAMATTMCHLHAGAARLQVNASCQPAADAIEDVTDIRKQILRRVSQLRVVDALGMDDLLDHITAEVQAVESCTAETGQRIPTLSPSDFGPHNMLHDEARDAYSLIDLEFFGWDDAHKLVCDSLLHPLIAWESSLMGDFVESTARIYRLDSKRMAATFPWCSLKWATIVAGRAARQFGAEQLDLAHESINKAHLYVRRAVKSRGLLRGPSGLEATVLWEPPQ